MAIVVSWRRASCVVPRGFPQPNYSLWPHSKAANRSEASKSGVEAAGRGRKNIQLHWFAHLISIRKSAIAGELALGDLHPYNPALCNCRGIRLLTTRAEVPFPGVLSDGSP